MIYIHIHKEKWPVRVLKLSTVGFARRRAELNWSLAGNSMEKGEKGERIRGKKECPILFYNLLEWHLRISTMGEVAVQTQIDDGGNKRAFSWQTFWKCQPFMLLRRPISYLLQQAFCVRYFRFQSSPRCKSSANLPPLRISASANALFPPTAAAPPPQTPLWCDRTNRDLLGLRLWKDLWSRSRFL